MLGPFGWAQGKGREGAGKSREGAGKGWEGVGKAGKSREGAVPLTVDHQRCRHNPPAGRGAGATSWHPPRCVVDRQHRPARPRRSPPPLRCFLLAGEDQGPRFLEQLGLRFPLHRETVYESTGRRRRAAIGSSRAVAIEGLKEAGRKSRQELMTTPEPPAGWAGRSPRHRPWLGRRRRGGSCPIAPGRGEAGGWRGPNNTRRRISGRKKEAGACESSRRGSPLRGTGVRRGADQEGRSQVELCLFKEREGPRWSFVASIV